MILPALYHWSPSVRYDSIKAHGLNVSSESTVATEPIPLICLSPDPRRGWQLSGAMEWVNDVSEWDLWLVELAKTDHVRIREDWGPEIQEIKVHNSIPADRVWFVGRRHTNGPLSLDGRELIEVDGHSA